MSENRVIAGIDAGGTTFKCGLFDGSNQIITKTRVPTTSPGETLQICADFFREKVAAGQEISAMGIASFGPINVDRDSKAYGTILDGPKSDWAGTNLKSFFEQTLDLPVSIDTDVNGALLAEMEWGAAKGCDKAVYVTIGTGIGAGIFANGGLIGKPSHPEFGHIRLRRHANDMDFKGICALHGDCLEGLASAPALKRRFGNPEKLVKNHIGWDMEAYYLAQACSTLTFSFRPQRIILGGGIMLTHHLLDAIKTQYAELQNGYLNETREDIDRLIVTPGLGDDAGLFGGTYLAKSLLN